jgi:hypothetical protein
MKRALTADAEDELTEAALWYEDRREGLGVEFLRKLNGSSGESRKTRSSIRWSISTSAGLLSGDSLTASMTSLTGTP